MIQHSNKIKPSHALLNMLIVATIKINGACEGLILIKLASSMQINLVKVGQVVT